MAPARDAGRAASLNLSNSVEATDAGSGREALCQREKPRVTLRSSQQGQAQRLNIRCDGQARSQDLTPGTLLRYFFVCPIKADGAIGVLGTHRTARGRGS